MSQDQPFGRDCGNQTFMAKLLLGNHFHLGRQKDKDNCLSEETRNTIPVEICLGSKKKKRGAVSFCIATVTSKSPPVTNKLPSQHSAAATKKTTELIRHSINQQHCSSAVMWLLLSCLVYIHKQKFPLAGLVNTVSPRLSWFKTVTYCHTELMFPKHQGWQVILSSLVPPGHQVWRS